MPEQPAEIALRDLRVRPVSGAVERAAWDRLTEAHHYLGFRSLFGAAVRAFRSPRNGRLEALSGSSFHRILSALDRALRHWAASRQESGGALALDDKAASEQVGGRTRSGCGSPRWPTAAG